MKSVAKLITAVAVNSLALWGAGNYIPGFVLAGGAIKLIALAVILTVLNFILKPILKLALGPVIILTLGFGLILVNAVILYLLPILAGYIDFLRGSIRIETIPALIFATLAIGVVNIIFHLANEQ